MASAVFLVNGSDHIAVSTRFLFSGTVPPPEPGEGDSGDGAGSPTGDIRISQLLPNPAGPDGGHETVTLENTGNNEIDLGGWKLRDKANNSVSLSGTIAAGNTRTIPLAEREMPLNNNGDTIRLLNPAGDAVY